MSQFKNDRFLRAILREPIDRTPVWIMRQAGRYLPEYRATRERAGSFMTLCKTPELACEVTLQPLARFNLDAAIIFSDILTIPDAMGLGLHFVENHGPKFERPVRNEAFINSLEVPDPAQLAYVYEAIKLVKHDLADKIPLIGFCGSPWTLATYMIEGESKTNFSIINKMLLENPSSLHKLLDKLAKAVAMHLAMQIEAGASAVMIFDTWGGMLSTENYYEFSLNYSKQIIKELKQYNKNRVPLILFTKGGQRWLEPMAESGCDVIGVDWEITLKEARLRTKDKVALQGNMNPAVLRETAEHIEQQVAAILSSFGQGSGHVFNLGHGITPDVSPEKVSVLIDAVQTLSPPYHTGMSR